MCMHGHPSRRPRGFWWTLGRRPMQAAAKTVLVVEDNEVSMRLFHALIESLGHNVLHARNANEALARAREYHPDLIVMDIQLPEVSGLAAPRSMKEEENLKDIPIIAVTALSTIDGEKAAREAGCQMYMVKPISVAVFQNAITELLK